LNLGSESQSKLSNVHADVFQPDLLGPLSFIPWCLSTFSQPVDDDERGCSLEPRSAFFRNLLIRHSHVADIPRSRTRSVVRAPQEVSIWERQHLLVQERSQSSF
jgi:hypothetical protein